MLRVFVSMEVLVWILVDLKYSVVVLLDSKGTHMKVKFKRRLFKQRINFDRFLI